MGGGKGGEFVGGGKLGGDDGVEDVEGEFGVGGEVVFELGRVLVKFYWYVEKRIMGFIFLGDVLWLGLGKVVFFNCMYDGVLEMVRGLMFGKKGNGSVFWSFDLGEFFFVCCFWLSVFCSWVKFLLVLEDLLMVWFLLMGFGLVVVGGLMFFFVGCCLIWEIMFENGMLCCVVCCCVSYIVKFVVKYE